MAETQKPEFLRSDLTDVCLQCKMIAPPGENIETFLGKAITPPGGLAIRQSVKMLQDIGALRPDETMTNLGMYLADIPLNAKYGKMLIYGILFKCLDPVLTIVSILSIGDPFNIPFRQELREAFHQQKLKYEEKTYSDHFVLLRIFQKWNEYITSKEFDAGFCEDNYVNAGTLQRIASTRSKIIGYLRSVKLIQSVGNLSVLNDHSQNWSLVKACIAAGSYPEIACIIKQPPEFRTSFDPKIFVNKTSVLRRKYNDKIEKKEMEGFPAGWMIFEEKNLAGKFSSAKTCSLVSGLCIAMTAGHGLVINALDNKTEDEVNDAGEIVEIEIDQFLKFRATPVVASVVKNLRDRLNHLMCRFLMDVENFEFEEIDEIFIQALAIIFENEDEKAGFNVKHENLGSRPRIVTRDFTMSSLTGKVQMSRKEPVEVVQQGANKSSNQITNGIEAKKQVAVAAKRDSPALSIGTNMKHFMIKLPSTTNLKELKQKQAVYLEKDVKLEPAVINAIIEGEVNDPISKKVFIFHNQKKIVGTGILLAQCQLSKESLQIYFVSESALEFHKIS